VPKPITTKVVTTKVKNRTKTCDTMCPGFYVSILPPKGDATFGRATFSLKFWNKTLNKQDYVEISVYDLKGWTIELARAKAQDHRGDPMRVDVRNSRSIE